MLADRYVKVILTIIAVELLWLGVRDAAPPVLAQPQPQAVVITGFRVAQGEYSAIPVAVVGGAQTPAGGLQLPNTEPLGVRVTQPIHAEVKQPLTVNIGNQPITVQTGATPLAVDAVTKAGARPGM